MSLALGRWHCYSKYNILFINAETIVCLSQVFTLHVIVEKCKDGCYSQGVYVLRQKIRHSHVNIIRGKSWQVM